MLQHHKIKNTLRVSASTSKEIKYTVYAPLETRLSKPLTHTDHTVSVTSVLPIRSTLNLCDFVHCSLFSAVRSRVKELPFIQGWRSPVCPCSGLAVRALTC